jgi:lysine 2,3-aminomutase
MEKIIPKGSQASLPEGSLPEVVSLHLLKLIEKTGGKKGPIGKQFLANIEKEHRLLTSTSRDPLNEQEHEVAPGLIYKYQGRALWLVTNYCASYCRFCTRGRQVGISAQIKRPFLNENEIKEVVTFIQKHPSLEEIIISGGDPLIAPRQYLTNIINALVKLQKQGQLKIIRIGTRLPVSNPQTIQTWHYKLLTKIKNPYLMVHFNHPAEITTATIKVLNNFRKIALANILTQSVLLKGVNDDEKVLIELFTRLTQEGYRPYYLFQNDPVYWADHFTVSIKKAIILWQKLRPKLSGIAATARFVIDVPEGYGKIAVPEGGAWEVNYRYYKDFKGRKKQLE